MKILTLFSFLFLYCAEASAQFLPVADHRLVQSPNQQLDKLKLTKTSDFYEDPERLQLFSEEDIQDSSYIWLWDFDALSYELIRRNVFTYNAQGLILTWLESYPNGTVWVDLAVTSYTYDGNNNLIRDVIQYYNGSGWDNSSQVVYTFDSNNDLISRLRQDWDGNTWVNYTEQVYTYDNSHNELTEILTRWTGSWMNLSLRTHTYNPENQRTHQLIQSWNGGWVNNQQLDYSYDASGNLDTVINQIWFTDHWEDKYRSSYTYDIQNNLSIFLRQISIGGGNWQDEYRNLYTYDSFNNLTIYLAQNFINDTWVNDYQFSLTYDENNNQVSEVYQIWEDELTYQDSTHFYYTLVSGIKVPVEHNTLDISPNPAQESIRIHINNQVLEKMTISIYSQAGVKVMEKNMDSPREDTIDISKLPPGTYHIVAQHDQGIETKKFLKL